MRLKAVGLTMNDNYEYSGKEFDPINGLNTYDFHARAYHPDKIVFGSPDFHAFDYPEQSVYSYCGGNPIPFIDPNGMDTHHYDANGNFMYTESNYEYDSVVLHINGALGESERMAYGTIEDVWRWKSADGGYYDYLKVRGDDNAKMLFEFFANNLIDIEYMLMQCGTSGKGGLNYIGTSHSAKENAAGGFLWNNQLRFGYVLRNVFHNHPSQRLNPSKKDINVFAKVISSVIPSVSFFVYTALEWPEYGHYREFGADSIYKKMTMEQYKFAKEGRKKCLGY